LIATQSKTINMLNIKQNNYPGKGFTLIELLVVIAIIGVLAGMVLVSMGGARAKARDARRQSDMRQLVSAQEMYYGDNDSYYPLATMPTAIGTYLTAVPKDPSTGAAYGTVTNVGSTGNFCYYATMENNKTIGATTTYKYYTASEGGNFWRTSAPTTLGAGAATGCARQNP
jgi:prepilin-type N-terminal cleavage/methylation domain-containing protein